MFCKNCGNKIDDDAAFCTNCGAKISDEIITPEESAEISPAVNETNQDKELENKTKNDKLANIVAITILSIVVLGFIITSIVLNKPQNTKSPWISNDTFTFDFYSPYTFNHYNDYEKDDYEFDCYKLSSKEISELNKNPPHYFIYNQKKYEVDNESPDYFELEFGYLVKINSPVFCQKLQQFLYIMAGVFPS